LITIFSENRFTLFRIVLAQKRKTRGHPRVFRPGNDL
jgi:hypothetical protein